MEKKADSQIPESIKDEILEITIPGKVTGYDLPDRQKELPPHLITGCRSRFINDHPP